MGIVIGISGRINSGKTTLSIELAKILACERVSFSDYIKKIAIENGMEITRTNLQNIGQNFVDSNLDKFCKEVLAQKNWDCNHFLIVEGIRHERVLLKIKELISPSRLFFVYIDATDEILLERDQKSGLNFNRTLLEEHSTEIEVLDSLKKLSDLILPSNKNVISTCSLIISKLFSLSP